jgi:hypothetical protein
MVDRNDVCLQDRNVGTDAGCCASSLIHQVQVPKIFGSFLQRRFPTVSPTVFPTVFPKLSQNPKKNKNMRLHASLHFIRAPLAVG